VRLRTAVVPSDGQAINPSLPHMIRVAECNGSGNSWQARSWPHTPRIVTIIVSVPIFSSNSMEAVFCVDCLEQALRTHGKPEIFNSDQGAQFTSAAFTDVLKREGVVISMDGRGRVFDNIFVERLWRSVTA